MKVFVNHKMNLDIDDVHEYLRKLKNVKDKVVILPTSIYLPYFINENFSVGIQDIYCKDYGAYTGEVSPNQAKKLGVKYAMIGHSERRKYFDEENDFIYKKVKAALKSGLTVLLCVGEREHERDEVFDVLKKQLSVIDDTDNVIVSYEPVWSIGNGKIPSNEEIKKVVKYIKSCYNVKVLYGGSVNEHNIATLSEVKELDGFLVGSAALDPDRLLKILEVTR